MEILKYIGKTRTAKELIVGVHEMRALIAEADNDPKNAFIPNGRNLTKTKRR